MTNRNAYRGFTIEQAFGGWKIIEPDGAYWPEKYATITDAQKSVDFTLAHRKESNQ
jgi:hypothetical protein